LEVFGAVDGVVFVFIEVSVYFEIDWFSGFGFVVDEFALFAHAEKALAFETELDHPGFAEGVAQ
jgi:hypothetical protein